jgi:hypothetical protein
MINDAFESLNIIDFNFLNHQSWDNGPEKLFDNRSTILTLGNAQLLVFSPPRDSATCPNNLLEFRTMTSSL